MTPILPLPQPILGLRTAGTEAAEATARLTEARDRVDLLRGTVQRETELLAQLRAKAASTSKRARLGIRLVMAAAPFALGAMASGSIGGPVGSVIGTVSLACCIGLAAVGMPMSAINDFRARGAHDAATFAAQRLADAQAATGPAEAAVQEARARSDAANARMLEAMATNPPAAGDVQSHDTHVVVNGIHIDKRAPAGSASPAS